MWKSIFQKRHHGNSTQKTEQTPLPAPTSPPHSSSEQELIKLPYASLQRATNNFNPTHLLGQGPCTKIYRAYLQLPTEQTVREFALKRFEFDNLSIGLHSQSQKYLNEIDMLGRLQHSSLVRLYGYCTEENEGFLLYEICERGSFDYYLFDKKNPLSWDLRKKIACQTAKGIEFLHDNDVLLNRIQASSILLDKDWNVKISNFQFEPEIRSGPFNYWHLDPTYLQTGHLDKYSDVYLFGVFLLELITGRPADKSLVEWARPHLESTGDALMNIVDPTIIDQMVDLKELKICIFIVKHCISLSTHDRPTMRDNAQTMEQYVRLRDIVQTTEQFVRPRLIDVCEFMCN